VALTDDQRAMLRLLAQNEEGYEDIAALKGVSVEQVKAEVREALAAAAAEREEPAAPKTPEEPAPPPPSPPPTQEPPAPPSAPLPSPPPARMAPAREKRAVRSLGASIPPERRRFLMLAGSGLAAVAVVLILIAVIGGGSDGSGSGSTTAEGGTATEATSAEGGANAKLTQAELRPVSGQSGEGRAIFGRVGKEEIVLQVAAQGLKPNAKGESYTVWLYRSPKVVLRVGGAVVGKSGRLGVQLPIPAELLAYVAGGAFKQIYLSRTVDAAYEATVERAKKQKALPPYSGETVLTGEITGPVVKAAAGEKR
jgi:hypothetical protein